MIILSGLDLNLKRCGFPKGVHTKDEKSAEGAGAEHEYEDTTNAIHSVQKAASGKAKAHPLKSGYRN